MKWIVFSLLFCMVVTDGMEREPKRAERELRDDVLQKALNQARANFTAHAYSWAYEYCIDNQTDNREELEKLLRRINDPRTLAQQCLRWLAPICRSYRWLMLENKTDPIIINKTKKMALVKRVIREESE